jgi:hypothetical protein
MSVAMATGLSRQLTRQIGEHLIAAKLGRMGYVAAPFAGNVPLFDLLAADRRGFTIPIQVKTINGPSWQYRADSFLEIEIVDDFHTFAARNRFSILIWCAFTFYYATTNRMMSFTF